MSKRSKRDKDEPDKREELIYPDFTSLLLGKPILTEFPGLKEWSVSIADIASGLGKIEVPTPTLYTETQYKELKAQLEKATEHVEKAKKAVEEAENRYRKKLLRQLYSRYFSKTTVEEIVQGETQVMTGRQCELTIISCDVRCFTKFTNDIDLLYLTELLNGYLVKCKRYCRIMAEQ